MEFQSLCIFSCILTLLIILIKPFTTKAHDRRASGDCGTSGWKSRFPQNKKPYEEQAPAYRITCELKRQSGEDGILLHRNGMFVYMETVIVMFVIHGKLTVSSKSWMRNYGAIIKNPYSTPLLVLEGLYSVKFIQSTVVTRIFFSAPNELNRNIFHTSIFTT